MNLGDYFETAHDNQWGTWEVRDTILDAGFELLDYREQLLVTKYLDIAAGVFELRKSPWTVGPFDVDDHLERLYELHQRIRREGRLVTAWTSVLAFARKPPGTVVNT